jgi:hypothetical protein
LGAGSLIVRADEPPDPWRTLKNREEIAGNQLTAERIDMVVDGHPHPQRRNVKSMSSMRLVRSSPRRSYQSKFARP